MSNSDEIIERHNLKKYLRLWRSFAIVITVALLLVMSAASIDILKLNSISGSEYIARVEISGFIGENRERTKKFAEIAEDKNVKAVIVYINSPGGSAVGGEILYESLNNLRKEKPVVSVMGAMATSAGYLVAVGTERIFARKSSITGSIGVILQAPNVSGLAEKIGVSMQTVKTGAMKDVPSLFRNMSDDAREIMQEVVDNFYNVFVDIIVENRKIPIEDVKKLADGRVFTGLQALENNLIDEIGGEKEAVEWLISSKKIDSALEVNDVDLIEPLRGWKNLISSFNGTNNLISEAFSFNGLLSL